MKLKLIMVDTPKGGIFKRSAEAFKKNGSVVDCVSTIEEIQPRDDGIHIIVGITNWGVQAVRKCLELGIPYWFADNPYLMNTKNYAVRVVYNDLYWSGSKDYDWDRFKAIGPKLKLWRETGSTVLVAGPGPRVESIAEPLGIENWNGNTVDRLIELTDRKVILSTKSQNRIWKRKGGYDWYDAWCVVSSYSNIQAEALVEGIPVITTHCTNIGSLEDIENPPMDRQVLAHMAYHQWTPEEIEKGACIPHMENDLEFHHGP